MNRQARNSWAVTQAVIFAIIVRDLQKKFIKSVNTPRSIAILWVVLEPMMHISIWMLMHKTIQANIHTSLPVPLFVLLGAVPFLLIRNVISHNKTSIKGNKNFFLFRQIKPIDPIIAYILSELLVSALVMLLILSLFHWFGLDWHIYNFLFWLLNIIAYVAFLLGFSLMIAIGCFFFNFLNTVVDILMRVLYLISGIFFSANLLPKPARELMLYNPVFQFIELTRECFMPAHSYISYTSSTYLIKIALISLLLGVALYVALRHKVMMEIEQR